MGDTPLEQEVTGRWVVHNNYLELHFMQTQASVKAPAGRYEAIYLLGVDRESGQYQLHLFDALAWLPDSGAWKMLLGETDAPGHWHEFAVKFMRRRLAA